MLASLNYLMNNPSLKSFYVNTEETAFISVVVFGNLHKLNVKLYPFPDW
jgi:hypothetical protein